MEGGRTREGPHIIISKRWRAPYPHNMIDILAPIVHMRPCWAWPVLEEWDNLVKNYFFWVTNKLSLIREKGNTKRTLSVCTSWKKLQQ